MIQKLTYMVPADKCGVWWVSVFHLYQGFSRKIAFPGNFVKVSVKITKPLNPVRRKSKLRGIIIRTAKETRRLDSSTFCFFINNVVLLKKRLTPRGKEIFGPIEFTIKRKKFVSSFSGII